MSGNVRKCPPRKNPGRPGGGCRGTKGRDGLSQGCAGTPKRWTGSAPAVPGPLHRESRTRPLTPGTARVGWKAAPAWTRSPEVDEDRPPPPPGPREDPLRGEWPRGKDKL